MRCRRIGRPGVQIGFPLSVGSEADVLTLIHATAYVLRHRRSPGLSSTARADAGATFPAIGRAVQLIANIPAGNVGLS